MTGNLPSGLEDGTVRISVMEKGDGEKAAVLEQLCFSDPWTAGDVEEFVRNSLDTCFAAWNPETGTMAGYADLRQIAGEGELLRIAVDPACQGRGIGRKLLEAVTAAARDGGTDALFLEVRAGNERARNLYKSAGFRETGRRKAYYRRPVEDAVLMELRPV